MILRVKIILMHFLSALVAVSFPLGIAIIAYAIAPVDITSNILINLSIFIAAFTFLMAAFLAFLSIYEIRGTEVVQSPVQSISDDIQPLIQFLVQRGFKKVGMSKNYRLVGGGTKHDYVYIHPNRMIAAQVTGIDSKEESRIDFISVWDDMRAIVTIYPSDVNLEAKYIMLQSSEDSPEAAYRAHVTGIKRAIHSFEEKPIKFKSLQHIIDADNTISRGERFVLPVVTDMLRTMVAASIEIYAAIMGIAGLIVFVALLYGGEANSQESSPPVIFLTAMGFMTIGIPRLMRKIGIIPEQSQESDEKPKKRKAPQA